nr:acyl-CoA dehydrogenase family protein [Micromonospora sp. DSM 115978]
MSVRLFPELTDEQRLMVDALIRLIESSAPLPVVRRRAEQGRPGDPALRTRLAELGCFGLLVGEAHGGGTFSGNGVVDAALVASERGARLQQGPFVGTSVVAYALSESGAPGGLEALAQLTEGEAAAAWAVDGLFNGSRQPGLEVSREGDEFVLSGTVGAVQDADECNWIMVGTRAAEGPVQFLLANPLEGLTVERTNAMDVT